MEQTEIDSPTSLTRSATICNPFVALHDWLHPLRVKLSEGHTDADMHSIASGTQALEKRM